MVLEHIQKLLFDHDCVIMPDFGGLITHYESVKIHPIRHTFLPPSKRIAFNEKLKLNDGLLISTLAYDYKLTAEEAQLQVMRFVNELQGELNRTRRFDLKGIGIFRLNEESKIVFEYVENENYLNDSFGLPELVSKPVVATEPVILRTLLKEPQTKAKPGIGNAVRRYYRAAAALMVGGVMVTGLYLLSLQNNYNISAINPITLFQSDSQQIENPENTFVNSNSIGLENSDLDYPSEETSLDTFEDPSATNSDILIASTPGNQDLEAEKPSSELNPEAINTKIASEKNQKVTKKVSIAPGEAVLISARVSPAKTIPAKTSPINASPKKNNTPAPSHVRRNFTIDEINAALAKDGTTKAKPESTHTIKAGDSNKAVSSKPVVATTKAPERNITPAKSTPNDAPATINTKSERFYVIVNGYSTYETAERNRKIIAKKGLPGKIIAPYGDAKLYRIAIAEYPNREQALNNLPALKNKYGNTIWILKR